MRRENKAIQCTLTVSACGNSNPLNWHVKLSILGSDKAHFPIYFVGERDTFHAQRGKITLARYRHWEVLSATMTARMKKEFESALVSLVEDDTRKGNLSQ